MDDLGFLILQVHYGEEGRGTLLFLEVPIGEYEMWLPYEELTAFF